MMFKWNKRDSYRTVVKGIEDTAAPAFASPILNTRGKTNIN